MAQICFSLEVDSDVEVYEMKHEIFSLQTKIDEGKNIFLEQLFWQTILILR